MSEILQNRWVWIVFSGLVLAAGLVWLYTLMPYPTAVNWFLDGLGFLVMYLLGLAVISQFVLPVQTLSDRFQVLWHFIGYGLGQQGPVVFVQNGKLVARKAELHDRESGVAVLDAASASGGA